MFTVALTGRPNTGKSTLFNRLAGKKFALTHDAPGVTRDWREAEGQLFDITFQVLDTAGVATAGKETMQDRMTHITEDAVKRADLVLFITNAREGLTPADRDAANILRRSGKPVILVANKCDNDLPDGYDELHELGFGEPIAISAEHNLGMGELYDALKEKVSGLRGCEVAEENPETTQPRNLETTEKSLHLAIIGRPNAGKSTLVNALLGYERMLTGPEAGLTRDAVPIAFEHQDRHVRLVDTPGLRRSTAVHEKLEEMSVEEAERAIRLAHVVVLVVDANVMFENQDLHIAQMVEREGRALVIAINKWDTIKNKQEVIKALDHFLAKNLAQLPGVPYVFTSAAKSQNLDELMEAVFKIYDLWNKRIPTSQLNRWLEPLLEHHSPPLVDGKRLRIRYMTQVKTRPPTFAVWVSKPLKLPETYLRYLGNELRRSFDMPGVPLRFFMRKGENPYDRD